MAGLYPRIGLSPGEDNIGIALDTEPYSGCDALYYNERCAQKFDPKAYNFLLAEITSIFNEVNWQYDCTQKDNIINALKSLFDADTLSPYFQCAIASQSIAYQTTTKLTGAISGQESHDCNVSAASGVVTMGAGDNGDWMVFYYGAATAPSSFTLGGNGGLCAGGVALYKGAVGQPGGTGAASGVSGTSLGVWGVALLTGLVPGDQLSLKVYQESVNGGSYAFNGRIVMHRIST